MSRRAKVIIGGLFALLLAVLVLAVVFVPSLAGATSDTRDAVAVYVGAATALITFLATMAAALAATDSRQAAAESRDAAKWALEALARHDTPDVEFSVSATSVDTDEKSKLLAVHERLVVHPRSAWRGVGVRIIDDATGRTL